MSVSIEDATPDDGARLAAIYRPAVEEGTASFELAAPDAAEMARRLAAVTAAGFPYLVAEVSGEVAGYAYVGPYRVRPAYRFTVENSVYVADDRQGLGIGRRLLDALVDRCTAIGVRQMIAVIGDSPRQAASIALHRAAGFQTVGTLAAVGYKHGRWLDSLLMQRAIGAGDTSAPTELASDRPSRSTPRTDPA